MSETLDGRQKGRIMTVYCPQPRCQGHAFSERQLRAEQRALRPYSITPAPDNRRYYDPEQPRCFREHDARRAQDATR